MTSHSFQPSMTQVSVPLLIYTLFWLSMPQVSMPLLTYSTLSLTEHATSERATDDQHFLWLSMPQVSVPLLTYTFFDWAWHNNPPSLLMTARFIKVLHNCTYSWLGMSLITYTLMIYSDMHNWGSIFSKLGCAEHSLELNRNNLTVYCANFFNYINWWVH
jgi:hypothetical protein